MTRCPATRRPRRYPPVPPFCTSGVAVDIDQAALVDGQYRRRWAVTVAQMSRRQASPAR